MIAPPRETIAGAMARFAVLPRAERQAQASLWTMYYFAALIIPTVTAGIRTGRVRTAGIDRLLCTTDAEGHVVGFEPACGACPSYAPGAGFDVLVCDHLAVMIGDCAGLPAAVAWSNAAVMIDHALSEARLAGPRDAIALRVAESLVASPGPHPQLAHPYRPGRPRVRRVCCLRDQLPDGAPCPGICPRVKKVARGPVQATFPPLRS